MLYNFVLFFLVMFYSVAMLMITLSLIVSISVMRLAHKEQGKHCASRFIGKKGLTGVLRILLCLSHVNAPQRFDDDQEINPEVIDVDEDGDVETKNTDDTYENRFLLACGIDRFFFGIYIFIYLILVVVYSI